MRRVQLQSVRGIGVEWSAQRVRSDACVLLRTEFEARLRADVQAAA